MDLRHTERPTSANWGFVPRLLLLVALLLPALPMSQPVEAASRIQPALQQEISQHPTSQVSVIVQKLTKDTSVEEMAVNLGGTITRDLRIINAFSADLPAKAVSELAKSTAVRWVSLDDPVQQSGGPQVFNTWANDVAIRPAASVSANFYANPISADSYIWFTSSFTASGVSGGAPVHILFDKSQIQFNAGGASYQLKTPSALVTFDPSNAQAATSFIAVGGVGIGNIYSTVVRPTMNGNVFLVALGYRVPVNLPGGISPITWTGRFLSDTPNVNVSWKWSAAVYSNLSNDYNALGIKPVDDSTSSRYYNSDRAGTPENYKASVIAGARSTGGTDYTGAFTSPQSLAASEVSINVVSMVDSDSGPNGRFGAADNLSMAFSGFVPERTPDQAIIRVEAALRAYVPMQLSSGDMMTLTAGGAGSAGTAVGVNPSVFNGAVGQSNARTIYVDITASRQWRWSDFYNTSDPLKLVLNQAAFAPNHYVFYDAIGLRVTTAPGTDNSLASLVIPAVNGPRDNSKLVNVYNKAVKATNVWNDAPAFLQGQGMTVAVVDSGEFATKDLGNRVVASVNLNPSYHSATDAYGHGTFVSSVLAGDGTLSGGSYVGIAPQAKLVNVRVSNDEGMATESSVVSGLQWINDNKDAYNIKVVNMSLNSGTPQSYHTSPLDAAVEILWFNGITVVVSAGNNGTANLFPPANDPFVITVGATDDRGTSNINDDTVASFSAFGLDETGAAKPDLVAPGTNIVAPVPDVTTLKVSRDHPSNQVNSNYFRMSGTSMAAPIVAGAVALLLQSEPGLTPDQVKYRLKATAVRDTTRFRNYNAVTAGAGYLDISAAVDGNSTQSANTGIAASQLLWTGGEPVMWGSVNWNSVNWNSVNWNSVNWNSVNWNSVNWNSDYWGR